MISSAPSSTLCRPSFHSSTTRIEYCSICSGSVVATSSSASCEPLADSNAASFCSSALCCSALRVPVRSVTRAVSFGIGCRPCAPGIAPGPSSSASASPARARAPLELRLQIAEILVRLQLRIVLDHHHQALQRLGEIALRGLVLLEQLRVIEYLGRHLDGARPGARLGHPDQHFLLLGRVALHGVDEIRDEIGPALILIHDLGPGRLDALVLLLQGVVTAA